MATSEMPYCYFVSYSHGLGFGSLELFLSHPFASWADVQLATDAAIGSVHRSSPWREISRSDVAILNWILLSGPDAD